MKTDNFESLNVPSYTENLLKEKGFRIFSNNERYIVYNEHTNEIIYYEADGNEVEMWIYQFFCDYFTNDLFERFNDENINIEESMKYREEVIELSSYINERELMKLADKIECDIIRRLRGYEHEINSRVGIHELSFYLMKEEYFNDDYPEFYPTKSSRPFLLYREDENGILWMIPVSKAPKSKYEKIYAKVPYAIEKFKLANVNCYLLIQNLVPATIEDVKCRFVYNGNHMRLKKHELMHSLRKKSERVLSMIKYDHYYFSKDIKDMYRSISGKEMKAEDMNNEKGMEL